MIILLMKTISSFSGAIKSKTQLATTQNVLGDNIIMIN